MPLLSLERPTRKGMIRGRETRNHTISTKLTESEYQAVERACTEDGKTTGEWLRDVALRNTRNELSDPELVALSEIVGVRLLLVNVLRSVGSGQRLTTEAFDKIVDEIGARKSDLVVRLVANQRK